MAAGNPASLATASQPNGNDSGSLDTPNELTIEQLSLESGMSVRNIRSHQARGLLAPPEVRLRVGYYGPEHVAQLRLIRELQAQGFNLGGIKRLLDDMRGTAERLLRFKEVLSAPIQDERAATVTRAELAERFRVSAQDAPAVIDKAERLGVFVAVEEERYRVPSPRLLAVAEEVVNRGVSVHGALAILELIEQHCNAVAHAFVKLYLREIWKPFQDSGMSADAWLEIQESLERLRPLASDALLTIFRQRMSGEVESAFAEITRLLSDGKR